MNSMQDRKRSKVISNGCDFAQQVGAAMFDNRHSRAHLFNIGHVDVPPYKSYAFSSCICDDISEWTNKQRMTVAASLNGMLADLSGRGYVALVLNSTGPEQSMPVGLTS